MRVAFGQSSAARPSTAKAAWRLPLLLGHEHADRRPATSRGPFDPTTFWASDDKKTPGLCVDGTHVRATGVRGRSPVNHDGLLPPTQRDTGSTSRTRQDSRKWPRCPGCGPMSGTYPDQPLRGIQPETYAEVIPPRPCGIVLSKNGDAGLWTSDSFRDSPHLARHPTPRGTRQREASLRRVAAATR